MPKQVYQCEYCGALHDKKEYAARCEESHNTVMEITGYSFDKHDKERYPTHIKCRMSNGETIIFYRHAGEFMRRM